MNKIVENRWIDALIKTLIFLVVFHVLLLISGWFFGPNIVLFGLSLFWPHLTSGWINLILSIVITIVLYLIVYNFFTVK